MMKVSKEIRTSSSALGDSRNHAKINMSVTCLSADTCEAITKNIGELFRMRTSRDAVISTMASVLTALMQVLHVASTHRESYFNVDTLTKAVIMSCSDNVVLTQ